MEVAIDKQIEDQCDDIRAKNAKYMKYRRPSQTVGWGSVAASVVLLVVSSNLPNVDAELIRTISGIVFLVGVGAGIALHIQGRKIRPKLYEIWALISFDCYALLGVRSQPYKEEITGRVTALVDNLKEGLGITEETIEGLGVFRGPLVKLVIQLEQQIMPVIREGNEKSIGELKEYFIKLIKLLLKGNEDSEYSERLLQELTSTKFVISAQARPDQRTLAKRTISFDHKLKIGALLVIGPAVYFLGTFIGVDKNYAFPTAIAMTGTIIGFYVSKVVKK